MKLLRRTKSEASAETDIYGLDHSRAYAPHCDPSILHAPGTCTYCDHYPEWQAYREIACINFTGVNNPRLAPCPSTYFRSGEMRDQWPGNRARS